MNPAGNPFTSEYECNSARSRCLRTARSTMQGPFVPAKAEQTAAITGGTGAYRTARGEVVVRSEADEITIRLVR